MNELKDEVESSVSGKEFPFAAPMTFLLFFRPSEFFEKANLKSRAGFTLAAYLIGVTNAMDRLDIRMLQAEYRDASNQAVFLITDNWLYYWSVVLIVGTISGYLTWLIFGWWYGYRARLCGFDPEDVLTPRLVYVHSFSVATLPYMLLAVVYTFRYESYTEAYFYSQWAPIFLLVFPFWSCGTSYVGTRRVLGLEGYKPMLLFLILPILFYLTLYVFFGVLGFYLFD